MTSASIDRQLKHMEHCTFKKALGNVIHDRRCERRLSQERLALEANVDRTRAGEIERGEANPTVDTLSRIAGVLGVSLGTLFIQAELVAYGNSPYEINPDDLPSLVVFQQHSEYIIVRMVSDE